MVTGGSVWDFFGIGGTVTSGGEGQQHWHRLEKIGNDQYISFLDNIDIQHVSLHQTHCSYTSVSRRSNMTFDSLLNHPIGSGIIFPTKKKTSRKPDPKNNQLTGGPFSHQVNAAVAGPSERQVPWIRDFVLPLKAFSVVQKRNWVVVTLLLVLNPMEEMVVQVVIRLMSLTCSLMEAVAGIGFVFFLFGATKPQFGLGLVWLGFASRQLATPWKSMIGRAQISFWGPAFIFQA